VSDWIDLRRREAGLPPETGLVDGVPLHLFTPLDRWVMESRMGVERSSWDEVALRTSTSIWNNSGDNLLTIADLILYWRPRMWPAVRRDWAAKIAELDRILTLGRSAWRVNARGDGLERRIEETVTTAARETIATAPPATQDHLEAAWVAVYGRNPNADLAYAEAVRAVETRICPLVQPKLTQRGKATLGTVIGDLRSNSFHRWELALSGEDGQPRDIDRLIGMLELLWHAQVSRHGGAPKSRRQDQAEAQAAIHLAVMVVKWLDTGVLRLRHGTTSDSPGSEPGS
jgi:hypothetical protein